MSRIASPPPEVQATVVGRIIWAFRTALLHGLLVALPVAITFWILFWLYTTLRTMLIDPIAYLVIWLAYGRALYQEGFELPPWIEYYAAPAVAVVVLVAFLFAAGLFFQSRLHRLIDWVFRRLPLVTNIYTSVSNVVQTLAAQSDKPRYHRVVLIEFPHPGLKCPAFVTSSCRDEATGETILCLYVPTTPIPTSGYMLMIPEREVINLNWDLNETLQAVVSGGISAPQTVTYYRPGADAAPRQPPLLENRPASRDDPRS